MTASGRLDWDRDGHDWPHRERSRFVDAAGLRWHVQDFAAARGAEVVLLLHGTGAASHSWRGLAPRLAADGYRVVIPDLPGHGFSDLPVGVSVSPTGMAKAVAGLLAALGLVPNVVIGHSAGAAIAVRMAIDGWLSHPPCRRIISLNGALLPLHGMVWSLFSPAAKLLAAAPFVPHVVAWRAQNTSVVDRLLEGTGSAADEVTRRLYGRLVQSPAHVAGALQMMAQWDLEALQADLPRLAVPLQLLVGDRDRTVPPTVSERVHRQIPMATQLVRLPSLGHLAHEEAPEAVLAAIRDLGGPAAFTAGSKRRAKV